MSKIREEFAASASLPRAAVALREQLANPKSGASKAFKKACASVVPEDKLNKQTVIGGVNQLGLDDYFLATGEGLPEPPRPSPKRKSTAGEPRSAKSRKVESESESESEDDDDEPPPPKRSSRLAALQNK